MEKLAVNTVWAKKVSYCISFISSFNIDQFSRFFTSRLWKKFAIQRHVYHICYVATLLCKT